MGRRFNRNFGQPAGGDDKLRMRVYSSSTCPAPPNVDRYTREPLAETTASAATRGGKAQRFVRDLDIPGDWCSVCEDE